MKKEKQEWKEEIEELKEEIIGCFEGDFSVHEGQIRTKLYNFAEDLLNQSECEDQEEYSFYEKVGGITVWSFVSLIIGVFLGMGSLIGGILFRIILNI